MIKLNEKKTGLVVNDFVDRLLETYLDNFKNIKFTRVFDLIILTHAGQP